MARWLPAIKIIIQAQAKAATADAPATKECQDIKNDHHEDPNRDLLVF